MIPIFIIVRDRLTVLKKCLKGYLELGDVEIILHDNNSTYPPMIEFLADFEKSGGIVYRHPSTTNDFHDISEEVSTTINDWYKTHDALYYIVTDPDIELENPSPSLIKYYIKVLETFPQYPVVGPMLRIDDIPDCFFLKAEMQHSHVVQFWGNPNTVFYESKIQPAGIDTTFGMYRKGFSFRRLNVGIRVHEPYMARHLDWYIDTNNLSVEQQYYLDHASYVSTLCDHIRKGGMK